jgi:hypothetical protein
MKVDPRTGLTERLTDLLRAEVRRFPEVRAAYLTAHAHGATTARNLT